MKRLSLLLSCALLLASCRQGGRNVVLASLNRPAKIQLLCADVVPESGNRFELRGLLPASLCDADANVVDAISPNLLGTVTQSQTGEIAVVNFTDDSIIDTNRTVPGVTSVIVGEQPTGIQISPYEPSFTYVSSFSPRTVQAIPTDAIIVGASERDFGEVSVGAGPTDLALHERAGALPTLDEEGRVTGAVTGFEYRNLYAAVPELGQVVQIPVTNGPDGKHQALGEPQRLDLGTFDCETVTVVPSPASTADDYHRICPSNERFIKTVRTTQTCVDGDGSGPQPVAVTVDSGAEEGALPEDDSGDDSDDVLLVADANQPVIHRFRLSESGAVPLDPIVTGVPTTQVVVTPLVPATSDPGDLAAVDRYLYAVSAVDASVLAVEYAAASPDFGAVLPVLAGVSARANEENVESRNRLRSGFVNARAIEIISPSYGLTMANGSPEVDADDICTPADAEEFASPTTPSNMRGVFLAVSYANGLLNFLDIYDLNAPCRGGSCFETPQTEQDRYASIRRHRRRFRIQPTSAPIVIEGTPSLQFDTQSGQIDEGTGQTPTSDGPGLAAIECPESMLTVFGGEPESNEGFICASSQVWSSLSQRWDATWEGLIPESEGGLGLFADESEGEPGEWFIAGDVPFCRVGVLGEDTDLGVGLAEPYGGDRLLITGDLPPETRDDLDCADFVDLDERIAEFPVWFPIVRAFNDRLLIRNPPSPTSPDRYTLAQVKRCFTQFNEYQVHTRGAYAVEGNRTGFIHRVIPGPDDECVLDAARPVEPDDVDTFLTARAFEGTQYINPLVSFQIDPFSDEVAVTDTTIATLTFNVVNQFGIESFDTGVASFSLPASMSFSAAQDQLFFVDFEAGLWRIGFSPLSSIQIFE